MTVVCPICRNTELMTLIEIEQVPVYCNVMWPTRAGAVSATRGDIFLRYCNSCGHIFNSRFDPTVMDYTDAYENSLHFSPRFQQYAQKLVDKLIQRYDLRGKQIVEIGAGQGDFLAMLVAQGGNRGIGFDPAYKDEGTLSDGIEVVKDYYGPDYANTPADMLCSRHVFEHIPEPDELLRMVRSVIGSRHDMLIFFEVPNALFTVQRGGIWDIIYEHISYFTPQSLRAVFEQNRFEVLDIDETFGGQFLTIEARPTAEQAPTPPDLASLTPDVAAFAASYRAEVTRWRTLFDEMAQHGETAVIWGAGSKGVTFLNVMQSPDVLTYAVDINPRKRGKFVAGTGQEIVPPDFLVQHPPDLVIIMNANYEQEIGQQIRDLGLTARILLA